MYIRYFSLFLLAVLQLNMSARDISPLDYGLERAETDVERFEVLMQTHVAAKAFGCGVTYSGIDRIVIEIPSGANSIPLSWHTDFAGVMIEVRNTQKTLTLFTLENSLQEINVSKYNLETGCFSSLEELREGVKLLVITDETPWVKQRHGYNYGATRQDVVLLCNGEGQNTTVSPYSNSVSMPNCSYCDVTGQAILIENLHFVRSEDSSFITHLLRLRNLNDVTLRNIIVETPEKTGLFGDVILGVSNCTNVLMEDVTINGTYSTVSKFGYGIQLNNVWNSRFRRLKADGKWGIFGNNNVNYAVIEDSDINRFDIHCYGRDIYCYRTVFRKAYNQFSSLYGELVFEDCLFDDFLPVLFEESYSAYSPFDLILRDCVIKVKASKPFLVYAGKLGPQIEGIREELSGVSWPNLALRNVKVLLPKGVKDWTLFRVNGIAAEVVEGIDHVTLRNVNVSSWEDKVAPKVCFANTKVETQKEIQFTVTESSVDVIVLN